LISRRLDTPADRTFAAHEKEEIGNATTTDVGRVARISFDDSPSSPSIAGIHPRRSTALMGLKASAFISTAAMIYILTLRLSAP
jgi:hypothetical protein